MGKRTRRISKIISEEGFYKFIVKTYRYINKNVCGKFSSIIFELDTEKKYPKVDTGLNISFRLATEEDLASMNNELYDYNSIGMKYARNRLKAGDRCILTIHNNKIVAYIWVMRGFIELKQDKLLKLPDNKAYTYKGYVLNEYRGKRIHSVMYGYLVNMLKKEGVRYVFSAVDKDNKSALQTKLKNRADYDLVGTLSHIKFFRFSVDYIKKKDLPRILN